MKLYIEIENEQIKNHPALEDNLLQAFGKIPDNWVSFERVDAPVIGIYEIYEGVTYEKIDGGVKDVHHVRSMTLEEKTNKQDAVKKDWLENGFASWIFNEEKCSFEPPRPYPLDGKFYTWDEPAVSWAVLNNISS